MGAMTAEQIELIRRNWARLLPIKDQVARLFYARLFELDPDLRKLFRNDMQVQGRKLMSMINVAVASLDRFEALTPELQDLGRRHAGYGARPEYYEKVREALLWALEQALGGAFTPAAREAWEQTYVLLARTMQHGAMTPRA